MGNRTGPIEGSAEKRTAKRTRAATFGAAEWKLFRLFRFREEVVVDKKKSVDRAVKNYDFDVLIRFDRGSDFFQLRNVGRSENVQRRKIKRDPPIFQAAALPAPSGNPLIVAKREV